MDVQQPYHIVKIEWLDSKGVTSAWEFTDEIKPLLPNLCQSVGYLIDEAPTYKTIAQSFNDSKDNAQVVGRTTIPTCAIVRLHYLKQPLATPVSRPVRRLR